MRVSSTSATGTWWSSRWRATTIRPSSSPTRAPTTGVGGILRDVFTMGARPIAALNFLRFGEPDHPSARAIIVAGVVAGIGGYGNSFGVPTVGGGRLPHALQRQLPRQRHGGRPRRRRTSIFYCQGRRASACRSSISAPRPAVTASTARRWPRPSSTTQSEEKRPTVQVGDPFAEKLLLEACLEIMAAGLRHRDPGHGRGRPDLLGGRDGRQGRPRRRDSTSTRCPDPRDPGMTAYEMMLSESQERMLMVLNPEKEAEAEPRSSASGVSISRWSAAPPTRCASSSSMAARSWPTCRSRSSATRPRNMTVRWVESHQRGPIDRPENVEGADGRSPGAAELSARRTSAPSAGSGSSTIPRHRRQHRAAARAVTLAWCASRTGRRGWH